MKKINYLKEGLRLTNILFDDIMFLVEFRMKETYFTRVGRNKMNFKSIMLFLINFVRKSLQIELDDFTKNISNSENISKQAFSQARQKISPEAFVRMLDEINKWFYKDTPFKKYKGYRLLAIDGSVIEINNCEELRKEFGYVKNQNANVARGRSAALYDIENDMILAAKLMHFRTGEREIAQNLINKLIQEGTYNDLIIFDRGYPSQDFIQFIEEKKIKYLMRVSRRFLKVVVNAPNEDQVIEVDYKGYPLKMRVIKLELDSGEIETLITNVFDSELNVADFKKLYFKRWGIEIKFNEIKNKLQIENFSGETPIAIQQDFNATMYLANMVSLAKKDAEDVIEKKYKDKNLKYEYKVNTNVLIGKLKNNLVQMLIEIRPWKRRKMLKEIGDEIARNVIPIRPNRKFPRKNKSTETQNVLTRKRAL